MKLIVNETFQFRGVHREGTTITVSESFLEAEIAKGKHPLKKYGKSRWISGLLEHCTPANDATARFFSKSCGEDVEPAEDPTDEQDDSEEILEIRAEFEKLGKAFHPRWQLKRLQNEIIKARKEAGDEKEEAASLQETLNENVQ